MNMIHMLRNRSYDKTLIFGVLFWVLNILTSQRLLGHSSRLRFRDVNVPALIKNPKQRKIQKR